MRILVTGSNGFVGRNLCAALSARGDTELLTFDIGSTEEQLREYCSRADFVFHLAGVNRPTDESEFETGNHLFTRKLLDYLEAAENDCPVMLSSSVQAELDNPYGKSKLAAERELELHSEKRGSPAYIFRFTNLFGKWCRPAYNSVTATFCHNVAGGLPITVNDPDKRLKLCYIDDVVDTLISAAEGKLKSGRCGVETEYEVTVGELAGLITGFAESRKKGYLPDIRSEFDNKLYATYLTYLSEDALNTALLPHCDPRGSFTELLRSESAGQVSINITKPGVTKGGHYHNTKNEKFIVVSGSGVIRIRRVGDTHIMRYEVSGDCPRSIDIPPGCTHDITNVGDGDLVTVMWANECYDPNRPDTFRLDV